MVQKKHIFISIFIVGICLSIGIYSWQLKIFDAVQVPEISQNQLQQKIDDGESFFVYFYSPTCEECLKSEPKMLQAVKELMIDNLVKVDLQKFGSLREELRIQGTPSIFVYKNHKMIKGITGGFKTAEEYKEFFEIGGTT